MLKYHFRVYDSDDNLKFSAIVPDVHIFEWLDKYKNEGIVKCYIINDEESEK